jgi:hypothetical protein
MLPSTLSLSKGRQNRLQRGDRVSTAKETPDDSPKRGPAVSAARRPKLLMLLVPLALFAGALIPRLWAIGWGLPTAQHVDEPALLEVAVRMLRDRTLNPHQFVYPSLTYELFAAAIRLSVWWSNLRGHAFAIQDLPLDNYRTTTAPMIFIWARGTTALLGAATVPALWALGRRMFGWRVGLLAALLLLVARFHIRHSHYATPDVPTGLWVTLALIGAWQVARDGSWRGYLLAGLGAGLAAGTKYNAGAVALAVVLAHTLHWRRDLLGRPFLRLCAGGAVALLVFLATTPYALLDSQAFLAALRENSRNYAEGGRGDYNGRWPIGWYAQFFWDSGLYAPGCMIALLGLPLVLRRRPQAAALLLVTALAEMALLLSYKVHYLRNLFPIYPALILLAAAGAVALADLAADRFARALPNPSGQSVLPRRHQDTKAEISLPDTFESSSLRGEIPSAALPEAVPAPPHSAGWLSAAIVVVLAVVLGAQQLSEAVALLAYWSPPYTLVDAMAFVRAQPRGMRVAAEVQPVIADGDVNVDVVDRLTEHTAEWYRANGYRYLIADEDHRTKDDSAAYARLVAGARVLAEYPPRHDGVRVGPGGAVLDLGEHPEAMPFARHQMVFGDKLALLGYEIRPGRLRALWNPLGGVAAREIPAGQPVQINLYFRALAKMDRDYTLFVHVLDGQGNRVAQRDLPVRHDDYPTSRWQPGELVLDRADLPLPALPPGAYRFDVGLYDAASGERLPVGEPAASAPHPDELLTVTVTPAGSG